MKRLILAVCLVFMVGVGFAIDYLPKTFTTSTFIAKVHDDGKIKYALTKDEIAWYICSDFSTYFCGLSITKNYEKYNHGKIDFTSCKLYTIRVGNTVYLEIFYSFDLLPEYSDKGIPLKEVQRISDKAGDLFIEAWESIEDPIIDEIKNGI